MQKLLVFISIFIISACSTPPGMVEPGKSVQMKPGDGIIVGSFPIDSEKDPGYDRRFLFRKIGVNETYYITQSQTMEQILISSKIGSQKDPYTLYAFSLPSGQYEFYNFSLYYTNGMVSKSWASKQDFSIPFTIVAGQVSYLGEVRTIPEFGKNFFGMSIPNAASFVISDQFTRDVPQLKKKYPDFNWSTLRNTSLKQGNVPPMIKIVP